MIVSKMHCGIIITSLQAVCKVTDDNTKSTVKIKLVFANNCQLKSFFFSVGKRKSKSFLL